ncbi:MAG: tRNA (N(6)-L-threonylcarbamoyladenosine(37)-C(2))-methylthiotransferase MtaB [Bacilli bacterium]|nr:tRNA (N(6)-L-threonylcarbamoyladenosine(37)-C(2))-methylthiotransferase MtaB [Bacilli bacterium]
MKTFKIISLGCKVNSYECASLAAMLIERGYFECKDQNPDVVIINTCSVTSTADQKSRQHIRKMINNYPKAIVVAMGCYVQGNKDFVLNEIKPAILVGTSNRDKIPDLINQYTINHEQICLVDEDPRHFDYEEMGVTSFTDNIRAYLKIQDGCDNFCSYCLIPYRRGRLRSRNKDNIIKEAQYLIDQGYEEIVLTGIHVGGYGTDLSTYHFSDLVDDLSGLNNLHSLRISSIEESEIDDHLIRLVSERNNIAKHLHIPLQSGNDKTLLAMNRKYTVKQFKEKLDQIRKLTNNIMISTDVIVGFPDESDEDFLKTYEFIKNSGINMLHVFPFSPREGTVAYSLDHQVPSNIKSQRAKQLIGLSNELWEKYVNQFIGQEMEILVEKYSDGLNIGHTTNYIKLGVPSNTSLVGKRIKTIIEKSKVLPN